MTPRHDVIDPRLVTWWVALFLAMPPRWGLKMGPVNVRLPDILLGLGVVFCVLVLPGAIARIGRAPGVKGFLVALLLCAVTLPLKGAHYADGQLFRRFTVPTLISFLVFAALLASWEHLIAVLRGVIYAAILVAGGLWWKFGTGTLGVRPIPNLIFIQHSGYSYIAVGVLGGTAFLVGWVILGQRLPWRIGWREKLAGWAGVVVGGFLVLFSGTRAVFIGGFLGLMQIWMPLRIRRALIGPARLLLAGSIVLILLVSNAPGVMWWITPRPLHVITVSETSGADRLVDEEGYGTALKSRVAWWEDMERGHGLREIFLGDDYASAVGRAGVVGHPHNLFVWMRLVGGIGASVAAGLGMGILGWWAVGGLAGGPGEVGRMVVLGMLGILLPTYVTNSWISGINYYISLAYAIAGWTCSLQEDEPRTTWRKEHQRLQEGPRG